MSRSESPNYERGYRDGWKNAATRSEQELMVEARLDEVALLLGGDEDFHCYAEERIAQLRQQQEEKDE